MDSPARIKEALQKTNNNIVSAAKAFDRKEGSVSLTVASKTQSIESIEVVLKEGHRQFGENRVQEAVSKWTVLKKKYPDTKLHLIGPLQTNKAASAVALFDVIETIDRPKLAKAVARFRKEKSRNITCYVQVNTGEEPQKAGVAPKDIDSFISLCITDLDLPVAGLMCIPPAEDEPAPHFLLLNKIALRNGLKNLSMGMSADYETAIQFGSTAVRIGTSIFGKRPA